MSRIVNGLKVTVLTRSAIFLPDTLKVTGSTISTPKSYDEHPRQVKYGSPPPPPPGTNLGNTFCLGSTRTCIAWDAQKALHFLFRRWNTDNKELYGKTQAVTRLFRMRLHSSNFGIQFFLSLNRRAFRRGTGRRKCDLSKSLCIVVFCEMCHYVCIYPKLQLCL